GFQPSKVVARLPADAVRSGEKTPDQNPSVRLHYDGPDKTVRVRVERICQAGGGVEPDDIVARLATDAAEQAAGQNLPVRLDRNRNNNAVCVWIERISQARGGVEPGDIVAGLTADAVRSGKTATDQDLAVRLHGDGIDRSSRVRVEGRSEGTIGIQPGHVGAGHRRS